MIIMGDQRIGKYASENGLKLLMDNSSLPCAKSGEQHAVTMNKILPVLQRMQAIYVPIFISKHGQHFLCLTATVCRLLDM